jgi:hypothetical protein
MYWERGGHPGRLSRAARRGLPVIAMAAPGAQESLLASLRSGWELSGALSAPTIAVLPGMQDAADICDQTVDGPDLIAAIADNGTDAAGADLDTESASDLADAVDAALSVLAGTIKDSADGRDLTALVPVEPGRAYPMEPVLEALVDGGAVVGLRRPAAAELITGFGRVSGTPIAVLASRPDHDRGRLTTAGLRRITRLLRLAARLSLPVVSIVDSAGVRWEARPDTLDTLRDCLLATHNLRTPRFILLAGDAFGTAASLYGIGMRPDLFSAWPRGRIAADDHVDDSQCSVLEAARNGLALDVIHPGETHAWLQDVIAIAASARTQEAVNG